MSDSVLYQQDGAIVTLTLNRPERRNPISEREVVDAIVSAVDRMNQDGSVRAAILTGAGSAFSSGGDLRAMAAETDNRARQPVKTPSYY
jgi:enoyl-CoA hydratase/carnithine racemase